ncbi:MAG: carbamoyltransferase C-terminal domain-containing protein [Alphaproteobacteria bacterium]
MTAKTPEKLAWCHVDMDGLEAIYAHHGRELKSVDPDHYFASAVEHSLEFFAEHAIKATYFVIANDLAKPERLRAVRQVVDAGHNLASHSISHVKLRFQSPEVKKTEIFDSKKIIEDATGAPVIGFRAPDYEIDFESLELIAQAGYRYDTSLFADYSFYERVGLYRLFSGPFEVIPESGLIELPMPRRGLGMTPFHPCYAFVLSRHYHRMALNRFARSHDHLTYLFHLTDFADKIGLRGDLKLKIYTNDMSWSRKKPFLDTLVGQLRSRYTISNSEDFIADWPAHSRARAPQTILGLSTTHETAACVVRNGEILSAVSEERISRRKFDTQYPPKGAIRDAITSAGIAPAEIDAVAIAGLQRRDLVTRSLKSQIADIRDFHGISDYLPHFAKFFYRLYYFLRANQYGRALSFLRDEFGITPQAYFIEHHEAHASSAYRTGTTKSAVIMTADGVGDDISVTISHGRAGVIHRVYHQFYPNSFGQFYSALTQVIGFRANRHEGKVTGLAAYGMENSGALETIRSTVKPRSEFVPDKRYYCEGFPRGLSIRTLLTRGLGTAARSFDYRNYKAPLRRLLRGYRREDIAQAGQQILEHDVGRVLIEHGHLPDSEFDLALAGGVFANVKLNQAMSNIENVRSTYVFPNMGDGGLCIGAALAVTAAPIVPLADAYLGNRYSDAEIADAIERHDCGPVSMPESMAERVADLLSEKKTIARFDGRMEFGPRALGNRSILFHCADATVNDWLNEKLGRSEFMPFAPVCLYEDADAYFRIRPGDRRACEFMTITVDCTDHMQAQCPAAVHVDGTARPQLLRRDTNPELYAIIEAYKARTGVSCLINTSFNMHEEPIVRSPDDALRAFAASGLDYLILGNRLIARAPASAPLQANSA